MTQSTQKMKKLTRRELAARRLAVESAIGSLRLSGIEVEAAEREIVERHARGETDLATMKAEMDAYIEANL